MPNKLGIQQVMQGCREGNRHCQKQLVMEYSDMLYGVALRYMRYDADAKDVLQESFIRIFRSIHTFDPAKGNAVAWMRKVVINASLKQLSKQRHHSELNGHHVEAQYEEVGGLEKLKADDLLKTVQDLPPMYRKVFNLAVIDGHNHKEIANLLDITESTSRSNLTRAKALLRKALGQTKKEKIYG